MSRNSPWTLYLANSADMSTICPLYDASSVSLDLALNRPGRLSFTYPLATEDSIHFDTLNKCVILTYDGEIVWSGPILSLNEVSPPEERISIICVGWLELLYHRVHRAKVSYPSMTRGQIILQLLSIANSQRDTWITAGTDTDNAAAISKTFERFNGIGQGIEEMTSIEAGPDISVNPATRTLDIKAWNQYTDRPEVVWFYMNDAANLTSFNRSIDASGMTNRLNILGKNSDVIGYIAQDLDSQMNYQLFEEEITLNNVSDSNILAAFGEAEVVFRGMPRVTYSFEPKAGEEAPLVFRDFELGDKCRLKLRFDPRINVDQNIRVFSVTLQIDENGNHKLTNVQTVAS